MKIVSKEGSWLILSGHWLKHTHHPPVGGEREEVLLGWRTDLCHLTDNATALLWADCQSDDENPHGSANVCTNFAKRRIGCCTFTVADWKKIMAARKNGAGRKKAL